jgi:hypothetical protein
MLLRSLQNLLADFYGLELAADVSDYLVTDPLALKCLQADSQPSPDETLLIGIGEDQLEVALYLNQALLVRLSAADPIGDLGRSNLDDFCKVLEGVSHFVYLAWNAAKDKCVTRLELELQSEVDKYVSTRLLLESQISRGVGRSRLCDVLFGAVRYRDGLSADEAARYRHANSMVGRYCSTLEQRFPASLSTSAMMEELRVFYRMSQPDKFSHMHAAQFF